MATTIVNTGCTTWLASWSPWCYCLKFAFQKGEYVAAAAKYAAL